MSKNKLNIRLSDESYQAMLECVHGRIEDLDSWINDNDSGFTKKDKKQYEKERAELYELLNEVDES